MTQETLLELNHVSRSYTKDSVITEGVKDVSFSVKKGEVVALVGPSGCGKTTILKMIATILDPSLGTITYKGSSMAEARLGGCLGYVPQHAALVPFRTVEENITLPLELKGLRTRDRLEELLALCSLKGFENYYPIQLSGGMRQRVAIARALVARPDILLMDEPFASLDEMVKEKLNEEVLRIQSTLGTTIVYVTHNLEEAVFLANKVLIVSAAPGTVVEEIQVDLPYERTALLRMEPSFFQKVVAVRKALQKS